MIYGVRNAYPDGHCIDGRSGVTTPFSYEFFGDKGMGTDIYCYNLNTGKPESGWFWYQRALYYNGDTVKMNISGSGGGLHYTNGNEYAWQAHVFEADGLHDIRVTNGYLPQLPYLQGTIHIDDSVNPKMVMSVHFDFSDCGELVAELARIGVSASTNNLLKGNVVEMDTLCLGYLDIDDVFYMQEHPVGVEVAIPVQGFHFVIPEKSSDGKAYLSFGRSDAKDFPTDYKEGATVKFYSYKHHSLIDSQRKGTGCYIGSGNMLIPSSQNPYDAAQLKYVTGEGGEWKPTHFIKINGEERAITGYNPDNGWIDIESKFSNAAQVGDSYEIVRNYYVTPYYYFKCKAKPVIPWVRMEKNGVFMKCSAGDPGVDYSAKYYQWFIYGVGGADEGRLIAQSEKIYNGRLVYDFRECIPGKSYRAKIVYMSQDNVEVSATSAATEYSVDGTAFAFTGTKCGTYQQGNQAILTLTRSSEFESGTIKILRKSKVVKDNTSQDLIEFVDTIPITSNGYRVLDVLDSKVSSHNTYTYYIVSVDSAGNLYPLQHISLTTNFCGWTIYFLKDRGAQEYKWYNMSSTMDEYGEREYQSLSWWVFESNIEDSNITHNLGREIQVGRPGKAIVFEGNDDYDSFTLSFLFTSVAYDSSQGFTKYDQSAYENWRDLLKTSSSVLVKDPKGNMWHGAITENSRVVDYSNFEHQFYKMSLNFVQTRDLNKVRLTALISWHN